MTKESMSNELEPVPAKDTVPRTDAKYGYNPNTGVLTVENMLTSEKNTRFVGMHISDIGAQVSRGMDALNIRHASFEPVEAPEDEDLLV